MKLGAFLIQESPSGTVSTVVGLENIPESIRFISTLANPDYVDLFTITTDLAVGTTAEEWARAVLELAPVSRRNARVLWRVMGLRLGPRNSPNHVQGWLITGRRDDWVRAETASWYMSAEAVCLLQDEQVSISLSLRYQSTVARLVWATVGPPHRKAVPVMLRQAACLIDRKRRSV